jgi:hypothetical protein
MATQPRSPSEHYQDAERLLEVAESQAVDPGLRDLSAMLALAHATLASAPRRARRQPAPAGRHAGGTTAQQRWLFGDHNNQEGNDR